MPNKWIVKTKSEISIETIRDQLNWIYFKALSTSYLKTIDELRPVVKLLRKEYLQSLVDSEKIKSFDSIERYGSTQHSIFIKNKIYKFSAWA